MAREKFSEMKRKFLGGHLYRPIIPKNTTSTDVKEEWVIVELTHEQKSEQSRLAANLKNSLMKLSGLYKLEQHVIISDSLCNERGKWQVQCSRVQLVSTNLVLT